MNRNHSSRWDANNLIGMSRDSHFVILLERHIHGREAVIKKRSLTVLISFLSSLGHFTSWGGFEY